MKIYKYTLGPGHNVVTATISTWLSAARDPVGDVVAYALVDSHTPARTHDLYVVMTGEEFDASYCRFLGTVALQAERMMVHVFVSEAAG